MRKANEKMIYCEFYLYELAKLAWCNKEDETVLNSKWINVFVPLTNFSKSYAKYIFGTKQKEKKIGDFCFVWSFAKQTTYMKVA